MIDARRLNNRIECKFLRPFILLSVIVLLAIAMQIALPYITASAEGNEDVEKELEDNVNSNLDDLNLSELEQFVAGLETNNFGASVKEFIRGVINGDYEGGYNEYFRLATKGLTDSLIGIVPIFATVTAIAVLFSIINGMSSGFVSRSTTEIIYFVCYSAMAVIVIARVTKLVILTANTVGSLGQLMGIAFPILITLMTALGGTVSASSYQPLMAVLSTGIVGIINTVIIPCFIATLALSVVGNLSKNIKLWKLTKFFKWAGEMILGLIFSLFITFVTLQGITGSIADNISVKSAKFAISSYVPILGGYLSEGFDLVMASIVLIKNSLGFTGVLIMLSIALLPVIQILVFTLGLKLAAGVIEPIGDKRMSDTIYGISKNMTLLVAAILGVSFMFFIMVMLVIYTCNMGAV